MALSGTATARLPVEKVCEPGGRLTISAAEAESFALFVSLSVVVALTWAVRWPAVPVTNTFRVLLVPAAIVPSEQPAAPLMTSQPAALVAMSPLSGPTFR